MLSFLIFWFSVLGSAHPIVTLNPFSSYDANGISPHWTWEHASTLHFDIHFPSSLKSLAPRISFILEQAHARLSPVFKWIPKKRAYVVLLDNSDFANGATQAVARFGMILWVTPPESWSTTAFYQDWLELLIVHEYTHYLNLDTTLGLYQSLRIVFGDSFLPNSLWPPWMLEGLAVFMETHFTSGGRGQSSDWDGILRSAVRDEALDQSQFITFDKINGSNPYFPGGDTRYQFGYHLLNHSTKQTEKEDKKAEVLGKLSYQSGGRVPYFINGNAENVTGKDWHSHWNDWIESSKSKFKAEIKKIKSLPVTPSKPLVTDCVSCEVLGSAFSRDGKFLAYTLVSSDRRQGLYLRNLQTHLPRIKEHLSDERIDDKLSGAHLSFTQDSRFLIYSQFDRKNNYETFSDLWIYSIHSKTIRPLTHRLRARDPQVSPDGKWITFTLTENQKTTLAIAPLIQKAQTYQLGKIEKPLSIGPLDHVGSPHFSKSGDLIYYSFHKNGLFQEDLWQFSRSETQASPLIQDGSFNRYPAVSPDGFLNYVSNRTGVDNLYTFDFKTKKSVLRTNFITPLSFPSFDPEGSAYGCLLTHSGRLFSKFKLSSGLDPKPIEIRPKKESLAASEFKESSVSFYSEPYSSFPSLLPRLWSPLLESSPGNTTLGGQLVGFDVLNFHRYSAAGAYSTLSQTFDGFFLYSNRTLGSEIRVAVDSLTTNLNLGFSDFTFSKQTDFSASLSYPWLSTYSITNVTLNYTFQKLNQIRRSLDSGPLSQSSQISYPGVSTLDALFTYSNQESSNLAVTSEGGRSLFFGTRAYLNSSGRSLKWIAKDQEFLRLGRHLILAPSLKGTWSPKQSTYFNANAITQGRTGNLNSLFPSDTFDQMTLRGYPYLAFVSRGSLTGALDLIFPLGRLFRGWEVYPIFFDNLYGSFFLERTQFPSTSKQLSSYGGGLRLSSELFFVPLTFGLDYQKGLDPKYGSTDIYLSVNSQIGAF